MKTRSSLCARLNALVEVQHVPQSDPSRHYLLKNRYDVERVRQVSEWLIQRIAVHSVWRKGNPAVPGGI
ncbi:hypothetical protein [Pseudomonas pergaminensis]|jgi:hypothetical protein|nr:hypothetical protein [Pseudomonas sp.]